MDVEWIEPWWATESFDENFHAVFKRQLEREVGPDHPLFGIETRLVARGIGDDALFALLDGTGRFAGVHLTWSQNQQKMPWPDTTIYPTLKAFIAECMIPDHRMWKQLPGQ